MKTVVLSREILGGKSDDEFHRILTRNGCTVDFDTYTITVHVSDMEKFRRLLFLPRHSMTFSCLYPIYEKLEETTKYLICFPLVENNETLQGQIGIIQTLTGLEVETEVLEDTYLLVKLPRPTITTSAQTNICKDLLVGWYRLYDATQ